MLTTVQPLRPGTTPARAAVLTLISGAVTLYLGASGSTLVCVASIVFSATALPLIGMSQALSPTRRAGMSPAAARRTTVLTLTPSRSAACLADTHSMPAAWGYGNVCPLAAAAACSSTLPYPQAAGIEWVSARHAAERLGVSVRTVVRRAAAGLIPARRVGERAWLIPMRGNLSLIHI